jgi:hypothetical protein
MFDQSKNQNKKSFTTVPLREENQNSFGSLFLLASDEISNNFCVVPSLSEINICFFTVHKYSTHLLSGND